MHISQIAAFYKKNFFGHIHIILPKRIHESYVIWFR